MHAVDSMSYDAIRKRGQFAAHANPELGASVTYVLANPTQQIQNNAVPNANLPPPRMPTNPHYQYTTNVRQNQGQHAATANVQNASLPPPNVNIHTSPNKHTGSPGQYMILGAGGGYYHQYNPTD